MHQRLARRSRLLALAPVALAAATFLGACSDDEAPTEPSHTPASAKLFVNDVDVTSDLVLTAGAVTRVEVRFYHDDGDPITGIEDGHYAGLTFTPEALATPVMTVDHHFQFDVTAQAAAGTGTVMVGYGHDAAADVLSFGPFPVTVAVP